MGIIRSSGKLFDISVPVVVIGAGACGCSAALAANERGAGVLMIERDETPSGSTSLSGGQIPAAGTKLQKAAGITDSAEEFAEEIMEKAKQQTDKDMALAISRGSTVTVDWLTDTYGAPLEVLTDFFYPGHKKHRMHGTPNRDGAELLTSLLAAISREGIDMMTEAMATDLYADEDGRVTGIRVQRPGGDYEDVGCGSLILACNGFGGNSEMVREYIPEISEALYFGHVGNKGDAVKWGLELGADVADMGSYQGHGAVATPHNTHIGWPSITEGGIMVNTNGERFSHENRGYSEQAIEVIRQPGNIAWAIFNDTAHNVAMQFNHQKESLEAGAIRIAETFDQLVEITELPRDALAETIAETNEVIAGSKADPFDRDFGDKAPLEPPFYTVRITGALFHTQGGLVIDSGARVLRKGSTETLPNLFAGGGAARGLTGPSCWGYTSGAGLMTATTLGRLGGEGAAALVSS
jgi:fumarate reductase flavoprotein subunit